MQHQNSKALYEKALQVIPGGVNSPVRACKSVGTEPVFIDYAIGCFIYDADGNRYIDYIGSWGPMILGHRPSVVIESIIQVLDRGTSFGAPIDLEVELAQLIIDAVGSVEMVRMVNSGTEATMSAIRLARGFTGRDVVIKFDGCYHGHADTLLVEAGSGVATLSIPGSPGIPKCFVDNTLSIPYNDVEGIRQVMAEKGDTVACIIVEPIAGNMGLVAPAENFLETLREVTEKYGSVLIFDEVMTGFRVAYGGAQSLYGITPDITTFGKIIGGGMPVGAYGGRREIMEHIAPQGPVYQAGTLSGNPLAMAAGLAMLKVVRRPGFYEELEEKSDWYVEQLGSIAADAPVATVLNRIGSMMTCFFTSDPVTDFESAMKADTERYGQHFRQMLASGVWLAPSQFEAAFVSAAHDRTHLEKALVLTESSFKKLAV